MCKKVYIEHKFSKVEGSVDSMYQHQYIRSNPLLQRASPGNYVFDFTVDGIKFSLDNFYQYGYNEVYNEKCIYNVGQKVKILYIYDTLIKQNVIVKIEILEVDYINHK